MSRVYGKRDDEHLPAYKMVFHYLLHLKASIDDCGPCWTFWQYPMERLCEILQPLVRSRLHPYTNLVNNITTLDRFNYIHFLPDVRERVFPPKEDRIYTQDQVFSSEENLEQLWFPSSTYKLHDGQNNTDRELLHLKRYYQATSDFLDEEVIFIILLIRVFLYIHIHFYFSTSVSLLILGIVFLVYVPGMVI